MIPWKNNFQDAILNVIIVAMPFPRQNPPHLHYLPPDEGLEGQV